MGVSDSPGSAAVAPGAEELRARLALDCGNRDGSRRELPVPAIADRISVSAWMFRRW